MDLYQVCSNGGPGVQNGPAAGGLGFKNEIQSNLGDSEADFSKPPDFSNLTVSPDLFCYHLM